MARLRLLAGAVALVAGAALAHGPVGNTAFDYARAPETPFGRAADPAKAKREVRVSMADTMRFTPAELTLERGDSVRFVVSNQGRVMHEMVLGTLADLREHAELMKKHPGMEHDEPHMVHVAPGKTGRMGWRFTRAGTFHYGCLVPGHFEAGMVGTIHVKEKEKR